MNNILKALRQTCFKKAYIMKKTSIEIYPWNKEESLIISMLWIMVLTSAIYYAKNYEKTINSTVSKSFDGICPKIKETSLVNRAWQQHKDSMFPFGNLEFCLRIVNNNSCCTLLCHQSLFPKSYFWYLFNFSPCWMFQNSFECNVSVWWHIQISLDVEKYLWHC